ncbi:hypothetical protein [Bernardetia litoralis]|uniref:hypothetical protein n=1 Tax=Bernardetia litoralis TaxID=999 RepID=UPI0002D756B9|nr:hypothetical protein [Bernardetia litoralis]
MSLLKNVINKFQQLFSGSAAPTPDSARATQAKQQLFVAILEACDDGIITTDEMSDVRALQSKLGMSDTELNSIKIQVLQNLIDRVMEDNIVTEDEMDFIEQIEIDLQLGVADSLKIKGDIKRVRKMYKHSNSVGGDEFDDDDFFDDDYNDDYDDDEDDTEYDNENDDGIDIGEAAAIATAVGAGAILANELAEDSDLEADPIDEEEIDEDESEESTNKTEIFSDES